MREAQQVDELSLDRVAQTRACPGIFMFDASKKLLWADRRAWELCRTFKKVAQPTDTLVPPQILSVCGRVAARAQKRPVKDLNSPLVRTIVKGSEHLLVCGFAVPDPKDSREVKFLIVMEHIGRRQDTAAQLAKEIYLLTRREVQVIQHLMKGWSNKEIANELALTEQTVKEHLHRIMAKTRSRSRTAIVARVLLL